MKIISLAGVSPDRWAEAMVGDADKLRPGELLLGRSTEGVGGVLIRRPLPGESDAVALAVTMVAAAHAYADYAGAPGAGSFFRIDQRYEKMLSQIDEAQHADRQATHDSAIQRPPINQQER